ncbi:ATP-binding protein [Streptomyces mobaraensis NBRC 13819 = DSM 40847]|uniref:ATP-binding protein n=1 Tax=Streptomyces mobaraensis TaxID=35621 RepID=A0A5N5WAH1_STRMB|nr:ATP-binding protein [Streptomyces mobaraensis]KAB7847779.1 ATP-binding protein [Streptomyces mobaraensis]QTT75006.1 ATP-binding protein [Streptomyces mobaraensis NBRC 13819 = DSM 40847]
MGTEGSTVLSPVWRGLPRFDSSAVSNSASCALPPRFEAVRTARRFTGITLSQWGVQHIFDNVALVVSELVTNSLRYATPTAHVDGGYEPPVRLHLMRWTTRLVCAVRDPSEEGPLAGEAAPGDEHGRGLLLVDSFSDAWGWHPLAGALHGKVVWALFRLPRE